MNSVRGSVFLSYTHDARTWHAERHSRETPRLLHAVLCAGRPSAEEVVYNHIDIKLHPITLQLDAAALSALTAFFKVRDAGGGDERNGRRLDRAMGITAIARAGALPLCC